MSYTNMVLYGSVLPSYNSKKDKDKQADKKQEIIKVDDPRNRDRVKQIFNSFD